jgi:hypothetical protein
MSCPPKDQTCSAAPAERMGSVAPGSVGFGGGPGLACLAISSQRPAAEVKPARGEILVAAIDCKGIPMVKPERALRVVRRGKGEKANKKRMATVAAVHNQAPIARTPPASPRQPVLRCAATRA